MASSGVLRKLVRSLFTTPARLPCRPRAATPSLTLRVECLEDRAAPVGLAGAGDVFGVGLWAKAQDDWPTSLNSVTDLVGAASAGTTSANETNRGSTRDAAPIPEALRAEPQLQSTSVAPAGMGVDDAGLQLAQVSNSIAPTALIGGGIRPLLTVSVVITIPAAGANVPGGGTFSAYGYVSPTTATMTAWITAGANTYYGTRVNPVPYNPQFQWGFRFTGIPTGSPVSLTVQGSASGSVGSQTITITPV